MEVAISDSMLTTGAIHWEVANSDKSFKMNIDPFEISSIVFIEQSSNTKFTTIKKIIKIFSDWKMNNYIIFIFKKNQSFCQTQ